MSTSDDDRLGLESAESVDEQTRFISKHINTVQHSAQRLSSPAPRRAATDKSHDCPGKPGVERFSAQTRVLGRAMLERSVATEMIATVLGLDDSQVRDLAAELGAAAPPDRRIRLADDQTLFAGTLKTADGVRLYTPRQLAYLCAKFLTEAPIEAIAETLGRSPAAVKRKARSLGLMLRRRQRLRDDLTALIERDVGHSQAREMPAFPQLGRCIVPWTSARTKALCEFWLEGARPSVIAAALGCSALSVSTKAVRLCLPARSQNEDGGLEVTVVGYICFDPEHHEFFWSTRRSATQSAYRTARAALRAAA